jgi:hypothetical protein
MEDPSKLSTTITSEPEEKKPAEKLEPPKHWLLPFFASSTDMQDAAVLLGIGEKPIEEELKAIAAYYEEKKQDINDFYEPRMRIRKEAIGVREGWLDDKRSEQSSLKQQLEENQRRADELTLKIREAKTRRQLAWQQILKERFERVRNFLKEREEKIVGELKQSRAEIMNDADTQIDYLNKFYHLVLDNRNEHSEHVAERARDCEQRRKVIKDQLDDAQKEVKVLREIGITEFSATFLLTFGVLALAGAGGAAASLLSDRQPGNSLFAVILGDLLDALDKMPAPWGSVTKFFTILLAPILGIGLLFVVFTGFVWIAMKVADKYNESFKSPKTAAQKKLRSDSEWAGTPIIKYIKSLTSQFPGMDNFSADRQTYGHLIAYFPYLMLVVMGLFLFTGVAIQGNKVNLTVIVTGMALALLSATSTLLYVTYIIQPRWRAAITAYGNEKPPHGYFLRYAVLNLEFFCLLAVLIIALMGAALLPAPIREVVTQTTSPYSYFWDGQFQHISWGMVTVFMLLASFGLAYGIVQKGVFADVDDLLKKHKIFQNCVERYKYPPLIEDLNYPDVYGIENSLATFLKRQNSLEEISASYEMSQIFTPEEEALIAGREKRTKWPRWISRFIRFLLAKEGDELKEGGVPSVSEPLMKLKPIDYLDSEEAVEKYEASEMDITEAVQTSETISKMSEQLQKSLKELEVETKELRLDIEKLKAELAEAEEQRVMAVSVVNSNFRQDEIGFKKAFNLGQQFRGNIAKREITRRE